MRKTIHNTFLKRMLAVADLFKPDPASAKKSDLAFLFVLLAVSLTLNVVLGWTVIRRNQPAPGKNQLAEGIFITPITLDSVSEDHRITVPYGKANKPVVLYILAPSCQWCLRNVENINSLAKLRERDYDFIAISLTSKDLRESVEMDKLELPIYKNISPDTVRQLSLGSTPQTIVISAEGKILKNWVGAYGDNLKLEIESFFNVSLPGLSSK